MKKAKHLSTIVQFREALRYLRESLFYIYAAIFIFFISAIFGFLLKDKLIFLEEILKKIMLEVYDLSIIELVFFILQNNLSIALISIFLGIFLGIYPILIAILNGLIVGYVLSIAYGIDGIFLWWRLLPHGIFELPAVFISFALGIKLGFTIFERKKKRLKEFKRRFYNSMNVFLFIIVPLLIIAAFVEGLLIAFFS